MNLSLRQKGLELFEERAARHPDAAFLGYGLRTQNAEIIYRVDADTVWVMTYKRIHPTNPNGFQSFFWFLSHISDQCPYIHYVEGLIEDQAQTPNSLALNRLYGFYQKVLGSEQRHWPDGTPYLHLNLQKARIDGRAQQWRRRARLHKAGQPFFSHWPQGRSATQP